MRKFILPAGLILILLIVLALVGYLFFRKNIPFFQTVSWPNSLYLSNEELRHWFDFQERLYTMTYEEYSRGDDKFDSMVPLIDKHINKVLSEDDFFKRISPKPEIDIKRKRLNSESIKSTYNEPDRMKSQQVPTSGYKNTLLKEPPESDVVVEVEALTKSENAKCFIGDDGCFIREGYTLFIDLIAKKVIYIAEFSFTDIE